MWGFLQEEMELESSKGVCNSAGMQGPSHDCLHDLECVKVEKSWNCVVQGTQQKKRLKLGFLGLSKTFSLSVSRSCRTPI